MVEGTFVVNKIEDQKVLGADSGTYTVELPTSNYLAALNIRLQNVNGSTSNTGETIQDVVTKIEVLADGVTIVSLNGVEARRWMHFDLGKLPAYDETQSASLVQFATFPIYFGRDEFDKDVILPAHKFSNLQLKISWAATDSTTAGWTTSESNLKLDVMGRYVVSKELVNTPFLKRISQWSKTTTATGVEEAKLPVGSGNGAYRRVMIYAYEAAIEDGTDIDKYELIVNDSQTIINERWDTSQAEDYARYGARGEKHLIAYVDAASGTDLNTEVSRITSMTLTSSTADLVKSYDALAGDQVGFDTEDAASSDVACSFIGGTGVPFATMIDLGTTNLNDSLDVTEGSGISSLKLKLNVAASGSDTRVVSEQLVSF